MTALAAGGYRLLMLFLIETLLEFILGVALFVIGLSIGRPSEILGIALIAVGAMTLSPKKLISLGSSYSASQPLWSMALAAVLGLLLIAGGSGIGLKGGDYIKRTASGLIGDRLLRWRAFVLPRASYSEAWSCDFGGLTLAKGDELRLKAALLSPDATSAVIFYETETDGEREDWMLLIDATTGTAEAPVKAGVSGPEAIVLGEGAMVRRWVLKRDALSLVDGLWVMGDDPLEVVDARLDGRWSFSTAQEPRRYDGPLAFEGLEGSRLRLYGDDGEGLLLIKEANRYHTRPAERAVEILRGGRPLALAEMPPDILSRRIASWALSPDASTLAYSLNTLDGYREYDPGDQPDIYLAGTDAPAEPRSISLAGREADWLEYSPDGRVIHAFDARLRVLTSIDAATGAEIDRFVVYGRGRVDPAGIATEGRALLLVDERAPRVSLYRR